MNKLILFLSLFILSAGCSSPSTDQAANAPKEIFFFDLEGFFNEEIKKLNGAQLSVEKILDINGQSETLKMDSLNLEKELAAFRQSDINKTSWSDKYQGDTSLTNGQIKEITYTALEEDLKTRNINLQFTNGQVDKITINNEVDSPVLKSKQLLIYQVAQGYSISQQQKIRLMKENNLKVEVRFLF